MGPLAESVQGLVQREMTKYLRSHDGELHATEGWLIYGGGTTGKVTHTANMVVQPGGAACYDVTLVFAPALTGDEIDQLTKEGWKVDGWTSSDTTCTLTYHPQTVND